MVSRRRVDLLALRDHAGDRAQPRPQPGASACWHRAAAPRRTCRGRARTPPDSGRHRRAGTARGAGARRAGRRFRRSRRRKESSDLRRAFGSSRLCARNAGDSPGRCAAMRGRPAAAATPRTITSSTPADGAVGIVGAGVDGIHGTNLSATRDACHGAAKGQCAVFRGTPLRSDSTATPFILRAFPRSHRGAPGYAPRRIALPMVSEPSGPAGPAPKKRSRRGHGADPARGGR